MKFVFTILFILFACLSAQAQMKTKVINDMVNEIMYHSALVSISAATKNGGDGANANLSDLGIWDDLKEYIPSENGIRSTKDGIVTIELFPYKAENIMPALKKTIKQGVVSGCEDDSSICVIDITNCVADLEPDLPNSYRDTKKMIDGAPLVVTSAKAMRQQIQADEKAKTNKKIIK